jgi:HEAT repeat protein
MDDPTDSIHVGDIKDSQGVAIGAGAQAKMVAGDEVHGDKVAGDKIIYARSSLEELDDYMARAVAAYEARLYQVAARPPVPPDHPYKFLYPFDIEDSDIFFGRDQAVEELLQKLRTDRLTVLHARSGAGKTSLLNAGLSPRLIHARWLPVYARSYEDPVLAVKRAIASPSLGLWPELLPQLTLHEYLGLVCECLSRETQELMIILDQFEEFFVFWPERAQRQPFVNALADCYEDKRLPVRFLIGIRGDYFTHLATWRDRLPHIFHNEYYLEGMNREQAQAAITGPLAKLARLVEYEPAFLDVLLDDLARGGVELPHLQIICTRLYEALAENETTITLTIYEGLGQAAGVLGGYLNDVLDRLPGKGAAIAKEALKELVSSEATKRVLTRENLAARVDAEPDELNNVLTEMVNARLLRRDEVAGDTVFEMAHEHLIGEIRKWINQADLIFKQAEELLAREVANWRVHGTLIPPDRLELLYMHKDRFRGMDDETGECLLSSALKDGSNIDDWAKVTGGQISERLLLTALDNSAGKTRLAIIRGLGAIWALPELFELGDEDDGTRYAAAMALEENGDSRVVMPFIAALRDSNSDVRKVAARALGKAGDTHAIGPLIVVLQDEAADVRQVAVESLGKFRDARTIELIVALLRDGDSDVRGAAVGALVRLGDLAIDALVAAFEDKDAGVRLMVIVALQAIADPRAIELFIAALQDDNDDVRQVAAEILGDIGNPHAVAPLIAALGDGETELGRKAFEALLKIGRSAVEPLIAALRDQDQYVREAAARALGRLDDSRAVEPLVAVLRDNYSSVRKAAAWALGMLGDLRAVEPLLTALQDPDRIVREAAVGALGELGDFRATEPLIAVLRDKDWYVRLTAAQALGKLGNPRIVEILIATLGNDDRDERLLAAVALREIADPRAVEPLIGTLQDKDGAVRRAAVLALGRIGDSRAVEPLIDALQDQDKNTQAKLYVQEAAAVALEQIGTPKALNALRKWQRDLQQVGG